jgi:hypothetical protein
VASIAPVQYCLRIKQQGPDEGEQVFPKHVEINDIRS